MSEIRLDLSRIRGRHILCAVSGGADSVALLRLLARERDSGNIILSAAHFEHGIRGEASKSDMRFVTELCEALSVPCYTECADVPAESARLGMGLEECARVLRHDFLRRTRAAAGADFIALAHHLRDRAETVLMHILRGGGIKGAGAMGEYDGTIIRPLIGYTPEELKEYLNSIGQEWVEDATNFIPDNPRNALRLNVFPELKTIYPEFERALFRFAEISSSEDKYLDEVTDEFIRQNAKHISGITVLPENAPLPVLRRALRRFLPRECGFEAVERARSAHGFCDISEGCRAFGENGLIYIVPPFNPPAPAELSIPGSTHLPGVCTLVSQEWESVPIRNNGPVQVLDASAVKGCVLRLRQTGDFMRPLGMKGNAKLLSDIFTDKKIPLPVRERIPLLARGDEIIWACGVCISESARVAPEKKAVKLTIITEEDQYDAR